VAAGVALTRRSVDAAHAVDRDVLHEQVSTSAGEVSGERASSAAGAGDFFSVASATSAVGSDTASPLGGGARYPLMSITAGC
jgi:hypothetical protein